MQALIITLLSLCLIWLLWLYRGVFPEPVNNILDDIEDWFIDRFGFTVYDIEGRKERMSKLISMDAPSSIIKSEAWLLVYGYSGGRWKGAFWCLWQAMSHTFYSIKDKIIPIRDGGLLDFDDMRDDEE